MQLHDFILVVIGFVSECVGTLSGFGSSLFFLPLALLLENPEFVLALTGILHCFGNFSKILLFRKNFDWRAFWLLSIPFVVFTGMGALLVVVTSGRDVKPVLGVFLILYSLFSLLKPTQTPKLPRWVAVALSAASGLATGFIGTGGPIRGIALTALRVPKSGFVAVSSAIDMGGDLLRTAIYLKSGFMNWNQWFYVPLLALAAYGGAKVGQALLSRINQNQFEKIVSVFILVSGVLLLV